MEFIDFYFYMVSNENFNETLKELLELKKFMNQKEFSFRKNYEGEEIIYKDESLHEFLISDLSRYENYSLKLSDDNGEFIIVTLSPFLKEVSTIKLRLERNNYENNKEYILQKFDESFELESMMFGWGQPSVSNPYYERGYGHIEFGAHWMMWFGNWALQYMNNVRIDKIKENSIDIEMTENYIKAKLTESPWEYENEDFYKKHRKFMKKMRFNEVVLEYNKKKEFNYIEVDEDPFLEMLQDGIIITKGD